MVRQLILEIGIDCSATTIRSLASFCDHPGRHSHARQGFARNSIEVRRLGEATALSRPSIAWMRSPSYMDVLAACRRALWLRQACAETSASVRPCPPPPAGTALRKTPSTRPPWMAEVPKLQEHVSAIPGGFTKTSMFWRLAPCCTDRLLDRLPSDPTDTKKPRRVGAFGPAAVLRTARQSSASVCRRQLPAQPGGPGRVAVDA